MKKHFITILFCGAFLFSGYRASAQAADTGEADIRYLGIKDDMAVFTVSYPNPEGAAFSLAVKDQDGSELYKHTFRGKYFHKQFRLPKEEKSKFSFIIRDGRVSDIIKSFEVNAESRLVKGAAVLQRD